MKACSRSSRGSILSLRSAHFGHGFEQTSLLGKRASMILNILVCTLHTTKGQSSMLTNPVPLRPPYSLQKYPPDASHRLVGYLEIHGQIHGRKPVHGGHATRSYNIPPIMLAPNGMLRKTWCPKCGCDNQESRELGHFLTLADSLA